MKELDQHSDEERCANTEDNDVLDKFKILAQPHVAALTHSRLIQLLFSSHVYSQAQPTKATTGRRTPNQRSPKLARGLNFDTLRNSSYKRRSSGLTFFGTTIFKRTYSSPRSPFRLFNPC